MPNSSDAFAPQVARDKPTLELGIWQPEIDINLAQVHNQLPDASYWSMYLDIRFFLVPKRRFNDITLPP
ncbi:hypothetical protein EYC84_006953 [Monilinia fructicola]|uniref:Uncharacterized protein n=1 Tax=Monilinia fructicola TaxID=38448 RepID=A0A5M9KD85_MONFR|nr:hypothetical protein EYC84_006953 [Monilinia fructicola]